MSVGKNVPHTEIEMVLDFIHIYKGEHALHAFAYYGGKSGALYSQSRRAEIAVDEHPVEHKVRKAGAGVDYDGNLNVAQGAQV